MNDIKTEGGSSVEGDVNVAGDFVGGTQSVDTQINIYNPPPPSVPSRQFPKKNLDRIYREASIAHFSDGDLIRAQELYLKIKSSDPSYPGINRVLKMIENEFTEVYIDNAGRIIKSNLLDKKDYIYLRRSRRSSYKIPFWLFLVFLPVLIILAWIVMNFMF